MILDCQGLEKWQTNKKAFYTKASHQLTKRYDGVVNEDLNMKGMAKALHSAKVLLIMRRGCL